MRATDLLQDDHATVKQMLAELAALGPRDRDAREALVDRIADALDLHTTLEEELFYPALARVTAHVSTARVQHEDIDASLDDLAGRPGNTARWERSFTVLRQAILRHIDAEEMVLFRDAERLGDEELERLGETIRQRREALRTSLGQRARRKLRQFGRKTA